ncbi:tyrosine-type recombinase/integrase [Larsenimonas rhizosphaerae]|uniref:Integrase arm-type DNA-binding domain-containing protein n=1 Tax=Larsenimonas rhizosphaerae TaxID=2944682 RepID=A0AA41ZNW7_9GAMM|nr:integrase arm-type DNA-binding domain-containing protein [Larsenimonas rhizosphaerae]MCX2524430.1 integrase arm-type DNA-binding domain-containing protein [Larsenimonas rhizosphaerae]
MPLTARQIEKTKPGDKVKTLSDGMGLELRISPSGKRGWRFRYTRPDGSKRRNMISLGSYPVITLAKARELSLDLRRLLADGVDPAEQRKVEKHEQLYPNGYTFYALAKEWHEGKTAQWKATSNRARMSWSALELHVLPYVGDRGLDDITPMEWLEVLRKLERQGKHEQKRKVHFFCRDIYRLAVVTGRAANNPLNDLSVALQRGKKRHMAHVSQDELPDLVRSIENYSGYELIGLGLKLLLMTAVRPGELRQAHWDEFNLETRIWVIPAERMKMGRPHKVPLPRQAIADLHRIKRISGHYPHLFPSRNNASKIISDMTFGMALKRMGFEGRHVPHGTRHTVATGLKEMGYPGEWIEMQLSHKLPGIQGVYTHAEHMAPEQRPAMMQAWADKLFSTG